MSAYDALPLTVAVSAVPQLLFLAGFPSRRRTFFLWTSAILYLGTVGFACSLVPRFGIGFLVNYGVFTAAAFCAMLEFAFSSS